MSLTPTSIMVWCAIAVALTILAAWVFAPRRRKDQDEIDALTERLRVNRERLRTRSYHGGRDETTDQGSFPPVRYPATRRDFGKRSTPPALKTFTLGPREITSINVQRKLRGMPPMNRYGFMSAASLAATQPSQPNTMADWITYLIIYECLFSGHQQRDAAPNVGGSFTIDPSQPDNGCGGTFSGAGASGTWTPDVQKSADYIADGRDSFGRDRSDADAVVSTYQRSEAAFDTPAPQSAPDPAPSYNAPDPAPSYSAPDPSPSPSPSPSFDNSPSPSPSPDTSSF